MGEKVKKKKKKTGSKKVTETAAQKELIERIAELCALEQKCRERYRSISGFTRERSTSENVSLGDLMQELGTIEEKVRAHMQFSSASNTKEADACSRLFAPVAPFRAGCCHPGRPRSI